MSECSLNFSCWTLKNYYIFYCGADQKPCPRTETNHPRAVKFCVVINCGAFYNLACRKKTVSLYSQKFQFLDTLSQN